MIIIMIMIMMMNGRIYYISNLLETASLILILSKLYTNL